MDNVEKQKSNSKKTYIILSVIILLITCILFVLVSVLSTPLIHKFAYDIKNLPTDNNQIYVSTSSTDNSREYNNNYIVDINSGEYFSIKESMVYSAGEEVASTVVLGKYNGYSYVYISTEGIAKIKNGISSMVVSKSDIDSISMKSNRLVYEDCNYFAMCKETHLVNLDNEEDKIIIQSKDENKLYSSNIELYKSGFMTTILGSEIEVYDKDGNSIAKLPHKSMHISAVDENNLYFMDIFTKGSTMVTKYDFRKKTESQITLTDYYSDMYNIKNDITTDGQRLVDVIDRNTNSDTDLDSLVLVNNDNLFFESKDELKIFKVNKKTGVKVKIFDCSANGDEINDVVWI